MTSAGSRAVVGDGDDDLARRPRGGDLDAAAGEFDGVLDQVGEAIDDAGPALADRLRRGCGVAAGARAMPPTAISALKPR